MNCNSKYFAYVMSFDWQGVYHKTKSYLSTLGASYGACQNLTTANDNIIKILSNLWPKLKNLFWFKHLEEKGVGSEREKDRGEKELEK